VKHNKIYDNGKYVPQRTCMGCRQVMPKSSMIRVTLRDGVVSVCKDSNADGRGAYICKNIECITKAQNSNGLQRGLKTKVSSEIYEECRNIAGQ